MAVLFHVDSDIFEMRKRHFGEMSSFRFSELEAKFFLRRAMLDNVNVQAMRALLVDEVGASTLFGWDDELVLHGVAQGLATGSIFLRKIERPTPTVLPYIGEPAPPPEAVTPAEEPEAEPEPEPAEESDASLENSDAVAQAQALVEASEEGTPFCEECAKAKAAAAAASAAPPPPSAAPSEESPTEAAPEEDGEVLAAASAEEQAETLKEAAATGVPFCEECEKARKQREQKEAA